jgi:hypothetical protein
MGDELRKVADEIDTVSDQEILGKLQMTWNHG